MNSSVIHALSFSENDFLKFIERVQDVKDAFRVETLFETLKEITVIPYISNMKRFPMWFEQAELVRGAFPMHAVFSQTESAIHSDLESFPSIQTSSSSLISDTDHVTAVHPSQTIISLRSLAYTHGILEAGAASTTLLIANIRSLFMTITVSYSAFNNAEQQQFISSQYVCKQLVTITADKMLVLVGQIPSLFAHSQLTTTLKVLAHLKKYGVLTALSEGLDSVSLASKNRKGESHEDGDEDDEADEMIKLMKEVYTEELGDHAKLKFPTNNRIHTDFLIPFINDTDEIDRQKMYQMHEVAICNKYVQSWWKCNGW
jgi:hypothetical protein